MSSLSRFLPPMGGIGRALSVRNYRVYWTGQIMMVQGFWIQKIAAGWLIWDMTASPAWLGAVGFAYHMPLLIFGPFAGAVADRVGLRKTAIGTSIFGALVSMTIAVLIWTGAITPLLLVIFMTIQGMQFAFEFPARQSLIGKLVDRGTLPAAVAVNSTTYNSSGFSGPLIGGLLLKFLGVGSCFAANAFCMIWMTIQLIRINPPANAAEALAERRKSRLLDDLKDGFVYTAQHPHLRLLVLVSFFVALLIRPYLDFMPGFADEVFNQGEQGLANLLAAAGIGAFCFAIVLALRGITRGLTRVVAIGNVVACLVLVAFALTDVYAVALVALFFVGGFLVSGAIANQSLVQHCVDDNFRGRVISIYVSLGVGLPALGTLLIGWIGEILGLQAALAGVTIAGLVLLLPILWTIVRRRREIESDPAIS